MLVTMSVSTHASARDATLPAAAAIGAALFQPTRPRGTRRSNQLTTPPQNQFQPTRPRGTRLASWRRWACWKAFQPTRPRGTRRAGVRPGEQRRRFNPRVREGRDYRRLSRPVRNTSSFNPRVREGRDFSGRLHREVHQQVSTHASARDATLRYQPKPAIRRVSTHASARDATDTAFPSPLHQHGFNPRVREGRDYFSTWARIPRALFQPTRPRGTRPAWSGGTHRCRRCFNPRVREGRDYGVPGEPDSDRLVSTHASARDATRAAAAAGRSTHRVSTHASARDATAGVRVVLVADLFQPTRPRGTRPCTGSMYALCVLFQPTRPRGTRRRRPIRAVGLDRFQPTRPRGTRPAEKKGVQGVIGVSTHASARDATGSRLTKLLSGQCFNPRVREGRDLDGVDTPFLELEFQPTRPRGTRRPLVTASSKVTLFQPTRPRGTRHPAAKAIERDKMFQPTRPRGTRQKSPAA